MKRLRFLEGIKHIRLTSAVSYAMLGALVVVVGTFAAWQFTRIFSPTSDLNPVGDPTLTLKTSDHGASNTLLPNSMTDTTPAFYGDNEQVHLVQFVNGVAKIPRIQGEILFK